MYKWLAENELENIRSVAPAAVNGLLVLFNFCHKNGLFEIE